jgi:hypothetical protein
MAFRPLKVLDIELRQSLENMRNLCRYEAVQALVRLCGKLIGYVKISLTAGYCPAHRGRNCPSVRTRCPDRAA